VKTLVLIFVAISLSFAQQTQSSDSTFDINGKRVEGASSLVNQSPGSADRIETVRSVNGRNIPVETIEDKVVTDSGGVKIIERLVKRYDANGRPGPPEKVHIEERKNADGSVNTASSVMRADINGRYALAERSVTESKKAGDTTTSNTVVQRPTLNGSLEVVERREETKRESADGSVSQNSTVMRRDTNGRFGEAAKQLLEKKVANGLTVENVATYEADNGGGMQLIQQTVSKEMAGSNQKEIDVFEASQAGRTGGKEPQLREQRLIEKTTTPNGAVESISVRRPLDSDPSRLGNAQKVEEIICTGKCK
jgi:hypothetical protein